MPILGRPDGTYVADAPPLRRMAPHVMATRAGATVYFDQRIDVSRTLPWIAERGVTLFELMLAGYVRALGERPQMHRFVVGRRLYQRTHVELSFAVKKELADRGKMTMVKARFEPGEDLDATVGRVRAAVETGRAERPVASEKEMMIVTRLPRALVRFLTWAQGALDYFNLLPSSLIANDPLYASMVVANLGSIGLDAAYHHLYEYGTVPLFAAIGRLHKAQWVSDDGDVSVRDTVEIRYAFDERIADGYYAARTLELFKGWMEDPAAFDHSRG